MKIVYSKKFEERYPTNPVECPDRVGLAAEELAEDYEFVKARPASEEDILRVHGRDHVGRVRGKGMYDAASLAAGGACMAADLALEGEPAFALVRPPGHHASRYRAWGLCFFNNMAIAVERLRLQKMKVLIIDVDLHFGDGTVNIFRGVPGVNIVNIGAIDLNFDYLKIDGEGYLRSVDDALKRYECDVVAVSAGFDTYLEDWGGLLSTEEYQEMGKIIREGAVERCDSRRFAVLEGGYHPHLKWNIKSFIKGFS